MDTNVFRYVLEVDKCKNITLAAKHLFISQPALTKQLSKLEKELGFQLFDRAHTPITTTPQEDETTWEWPTEPAANSVSNVPKAASSASRSASSASSVPQAGSGSVREPSALQGASSPASSSAAPASTQPVSGRVLNGYSGDELVYNKTLGDWRTHNGIDYACAKDAAVQSPTAGTVVLAGSDGSWGPTVAIKDSAGRVWRLCGVASPAVKEGETVSAGQTLGKVGSVSCECAEESHIHLEVKQDDSYLDPAKLMQ